MIKIENMSFWYKGGRNNPVFSNFSIEIQKGEFVVLQGANGSGKSTLARIIAGITRPRRGTVTVNGINSKSRKEFLRLRSAISIIFQNPENNLLFDRVYDDIAFGLENLKIQKSEHEKIIKQALERVGLVGFENRSTYELSFGQKQRVAIAGILAMNCEVIVADEPTAMLDADGKREIYQLLRELNKQGKTIILSTHQESETKFGRVVQL